MPGKANPTRLRQQRRIIETIKQEPESRREWLLDIFSGASTEHARNEHYQVWTHENHAIELHSDKFFKQKLNYIHENPVRAGIVEKEEEYLYSSAKEYYTGKTGLVKINALV